MQEVFQSCKKFPKIKGHYMKWCMHTNTHIDGLVQDCSNSSANSLVILQSDTKPSIYGFCIKMHVHICVAVHLLRTFFRTWSILKCVCWIRRHYPSFITHGTTLTQKMIEWLAMHCTQTEWIINLPISAVIPTSVSTILTCAEKESQMPCGCGHHQYNSYVSGPFY